MSVSGPSNWPSFKVWRKLAMRHLRFTAACAVRVEYDPRWLRIAL